ncbi:MAG: HD domain-containing protein [Clostridia bacterium]|nr:HD domain-containing protein [Clostridia bacterium]
MEKKYPSREEAERLVREAEGIYPGPWGDHSRVVARCAEAIAAACGLDAEKAYVLGLLHDIGRRFGHGHMAHVYDGYAYMRDLGYKDAARICLTHSFNTKVFEDYIGNVDIPEEKQAVLREALARCEFDDYDRLIQLCDAVSMAEGPASLEERMGSVKARYGRYPQDKWDKNYEIKAYFEVKAGKSLEEILGLTE